MSGLAPIIIPVLVTITTALILATLRYTANKVKVTLEIQQQAKEAVDAQRAKDQYDILQRIEMQTTLTNGRVTELERKVGAVVERVAHVEGEYETVMRMLPTTVRGNGP